MPDHHVCPWWLAYTFDNPLRRLLHNPKDIFSGYVNEGMVVMDIGCGMGYFTLGLAEIVGDSGQVIAVDLQQKMLDIMLKRATRKGLNNRIIPHRSSSNSIGVETHVDFVLAFWMIHEVPDPDEFFRQIVPILKPSAKLLYAEPAFHVSEDKFKEILSAAHGTGLEVIQDLSIRFSRAALLTAIK
jgi:ubiquinone/menaquinone biosynthesis C-methylase UbiE